MMARKVWLQLHLWVALVMGWILALLGLSGALLVVRGPILQWEVGCEAVCLQYIPNASAVYMAQDSWREAARNAYPQFETIIGSMPPRSGFLTSDNAIVFGRVQGRPGIGVAMIDPYSAEPRGFFIYDDLLLAKIVFLHRSLLLPPEFAGPVIAISGMLLLLSLVSGIWLWWPRSHGIRRWRRVLTLNLKHRGFRFWRELHNVAAIYLLAPIALLTLTGIWLARPDWFSRWGLGLALKPSIAVLHAELMLGWFGKVISFIAGLALPVLYLSGLVMWWKKRRSRRGNVHERYP